MRRRLIIRTTNTLICLAAIAAVTTLSLAAQETGYIKAHGKPGDAGVFINGKYVGLATRFTVPEKYEAPVGEVDLTFRDPRTKISPPK